MRKNLKELNNFLCKFLEKYSLKINLQLSSEKSNFQNSKILIINEEIKNSLKISDSLERECKKYEEKLEKFKKNDHKRTVEIKIDELKKNIEKCKKENKIQSLGNGKTSKNLDELEKNSYKFSIISKLKTALIELSQFKKKNEKMNERQEEIKNQINISKEKNDNIDKKLKKALILANHYKIFDKNEIKTKHEIAEEKFKNLVKSNDILMKKFQSFSHSLKKDIEYLRKNIKEIDIKLINTNKNSIQLKNKLQTSNIQTFTKNITENQILLCEENSKIENYTNNLIDESLKY